MAAKKHQVASKGTEQNACAPNQTAHFTDMEYEKIIKQPLNKKQGISAGFESLGQVCKNRNDQCYSL